MGGSEFFHVPSIKNPTSERPGHQVRFWHDDPPQVGASACISCHRWLVVAPGCSLPTFWLRCCWLSWSQPNRMLSSLALSL